MGIKNMIADKAAEKIAERFLSSLSEEQLQGLIDFAEQFNGMTDEEIEDAIAADINKALGNPDLEEKDGDTNG